MKVVLGIDMGGTTTKIVGFSGENKFGQVRLKSENNLNNFYEAVENFLNCHSISINNLEAIILTGVGSYLVKQNFHNVKTIRVDEFCSIGYGGLYLSKKSSALVVSMGTGTAYVFANENEVKHVGGTGLGGGTLIGLSKIILNTDDVDLIKNYIINGSSLNVDLTLKDICTEKISFLEPDTVVSNFGNVNFNSSKNDIGSGLINMIYQSIGMNAVFYMRSNNLENVVLVGGLTSFPNIKQSFNKFKKLYDIEFLIPDEGVFSTAIGAVLYYYRDVK